MNIGPGTVIGGYRIERVLGAGGMGKVFLAKHPSLPRFDALKVLGTEVSNDREYRGRFEREANLAAALDHPNIVAVYNRGEDHGQLWIAMQYVDGTDASAALTEFPQGMTPERALRITTEVGRGLDHAHRRGLLHRDVKPANFMLSLGGGDEGCINEERVLLADFGLAKSTEDTLELTQTGTFLATIAYAAPEQLSGQRLDHHTDIYSLACSFYKLVTARNPYPGAQPALVMAGHLYEPPPRITAVRPDLPTAVDDVLAVAMAKNPRERFDSCHEFTSALERALHHGESVVTVRTRPGAAAPEPPTARQEFIDPTLPPAESTTADPKTPARKRLWLATGAVAVTVTLAVGGGLWAVRDHTPDAVASPTTTTTASVAAPKSVAEARHQNPAFLGKTIAAVDVTGENGYRPEVAIHLQPSPQATFFEALGFTYHHGCTRVDDEPTPRPLAATYNPSDVGVLNQIDSGYLLAVRSDTNSGKGSMVHLPETITLRKATVLVLDDPIAVDALRNWTDGSEQILLEKLVPILRKSVK
ncbi:serine/threonine-protein kinase [Nocardia sp. NPDC051030]|uniref:serine/threonine-protein kinase n=1 Tax=Nocardia sp. NPDC051030 TaxID=3155162 RepID=UPI0034455B8B